MEIPFDRLSPETLQALLRDFVTRDGTDYGVREASVESKMQEVQTQLKKGSVCIVFEAETESFTIVTRESLRVRR